MATDHPQPQTLPVDHIQPNPLQPRGNINPNSLADLIDSIKEHGIIEPLVIAHTPAGYQIIAGERRWRAAKIAKIQEVPCVIKDVTPQQMLEMAIVENLQREDLNALERAKAFERLTQDFSMNQTDIAKKVSKSQSYVINSLRLLKLPDAIKDGLLSEAITEGHARALMGVKNDTVMIEAYKLVLQHGASVRKTEEIARRLNERISKAAQVEDKTEPDPKHNYALLDTMQQDIIKALGEKTKVKLTQSERQTKIVITLKGNPDKHQEDLKSIYRRLAGKQATLSQ